MTQYHDAIDRRRLLQQGAAAAGLAAIWGPAQALELSRREFVNRTGRPGETDRPEPHVITHQEYLIGRIGPDALFPTDQLTSSGLEGGPGVAVRSLIGGAGRYFGAGGAVLQHTIGANTTGGPNFRFDFRLKLRRPKP